MEISTVITILLEAQGSGLWPGDVDSWSSLLLNLSKLGTQGTALWARALSCVEALTGTGLATSPVSSYVLNICARNSAWQEALAFFNSSEDASTLAFNAALAACQAGRKYELARGFFRRMCALGLANTASFNSLLGICGSQLQWPEALAILEEMSARQAVRNEATYTTAFKAFEGPGAQWQWALSWFQQMSADQIQLSEVSFTALISTCGSAAQWQWALMLLKQMQACQERDLVACSAALSACEKGSEWQRALLLFQEALELDADVLAFNAAISAVDKAGEWTLALELLQQLEGECQMQADEITITSVISACARASQWERSLSLLAELKRRSLEASHIAWNSAVSACEKGLQWQMALLLLEAMLSSSLQVDEISFNSAISACEKGEMLG